LEPKIKIEKKNIASQLTLAAVAPPTETRTVSRWWAIFGGGRPDETPAVNGGAEKENGKPPDETSEAAATTKYREHRNPKLYFIGWIDVGLTGPPFETR